MSNLTERLHMARATDGTNAASLPSKCNGIKLQKQQLQCVLGTLDSSTAWMQHGAAPEGLSTGRLGDCCPKQHKLCVPQARALHGAKVS